LIYTDAMNMDAVAKMGSSGENAVRAVQAGVDVVLDAPDTMDAFRGLKAAADSGAISRSRLESSVRRVLTAKARMGLHRTRAVSLDTLPTVVGTRRHAAVARQVSVRAVTLQGRRGRVEEAARVLELPYCRCSTTCAGGNCASAARSSRARALADLQSIESRRDDAKRAGLIEPWPLASTPSSPASVRASSAPTAGLARRS
jgi:beta-glucosidase-like glycosyl hydrolase